MSVKGMLRAVAGAMAGTLFYVPFILLPVIGPFLAGVAAGKTAKTAPGRGFMLGLMCGILGSAIWLLGILPGWGITPGYVYLIIWFVFLFWNLQSILLCALGALMGSMTVFSRMDEAAAEANGTNHGPQAPTYVVCPSCKTSNPEGVECCRICNNRICD